MFFTNLQILLCWFILCEFFGGHFRELAFNRRYFRPFLAIQVTEPSLGVSTHLIPHGPPAARLATAMLCCSSQ